jgi:hypothetical protein
MTPIPTEAVAWVYVAYITVNAIQVIAVAYIAYLVRRYTNHDK